MNDMKEVYFNLWCKCCKYRELSEDEDPCRLCLGEPVNIDSHKPLDFKTNEQINKEKQL